MSSQRSILGKWALYRRWEAHLALPALASLAMVLLYFFMPPPIQGWIAPGFVEVPFSNGRLLGLPHLVMGICLAWSMALGGSVLVLTRDRSVWLITVTIMVLMLLSLLVWMDGHSIIARVSTLWSMASGGEGGDAGLLRDYQNLVGVAGIGLFILLFFIFIPLLYGNKRNPVVAMLIPSRWLALTALVPFATFWLAFRLQGQGWDQIEGEAGVLAGNLSVFIKPVFLYMILLYLARLQYLTWVRREAQHWTPAQRYR